MRAAVVCVMFSMVGLIPRHVKNDLSRSLCIMDEFVLVFSANTAGYQEFSLLARELNVATVDLTFIRF